MDQAAIERIGTDVFRALQARARRDHGGNTQSILVVYAVESFLRRLAMSEYADRMILKGGMLMAAVSVRQMTRDADLSAHGLDNGEASVVRVVAEICVHVPDPHDGIVLDPASIRAEPMREDDEYGGIRCKLVAGLGRARVPFALDFSFGDPDRSVPIHLESLVDREAVELRAYPLTLNLAEKIVTAMQRRETSTRDRDFADVWVTSRRLGLDAGRLRSDIAEVAEHRGQPVIPMHVALAAMPDRQQTYIPMLERLSYASPPPERWRDLIADLISLIDPLLADTAGAFTHWDPSALKWVGDAESGSAVEAEGV